MRKVIIGATILVIILIGFLMISYIFRDTKNSFIEENQNGQYEVAPDSSQEKKKFCESL